MGEGLYLEGGLCLRALGIRRFGVGEICTQAAQAQASRLPQAARGCWRLSWRELGRMEELRARQMFLCACVREGVGIFFCFLVVRPGAVDPMFWHTV